MKYVGLTGGIGSGKSTVAKMFMQLGVPVYNSDERAKHLMNNSTDIKKRLVELLGKESYKEGQLNRAFIAKKVFNDTELLAQLNAIVHPVVREDFLNWANQQDFCYVIQETALLFENEVQNLYDYVILVTAPKEERISRVVNRDSVTREQVIARMDNQLEDDEKLNLSDYVVENIDIERTKSSVLQVHASIVSEC
ncbi:dephospho-CoA kinase [Maribacter litoralis]|uniref:dephospho-CoA kinase n=1 Tax=Maribacter litoralis TaxID=2059726 RepID=UPI000E315803|nr:dephospho-CoA kinase [Maribacter litoralis]